MRFRLSRSASSCFRSSTTTPARSRALLGVSDRLEAWTQAVSRMDRLGLGEQVLAQSIGRAGAQGRHLVLEAAQVADAEPFGPRGVYP